MICPTCRRGYQGGETTCPRDGTELVAYEVWRAARIQAKHEGGMICPRCGARYDQTTLFCYKDGTKLEPIN